MLWHLLRQVPNAVKASAETAVNNSSLTPLDLHNQV